MVVVHTEWGNKWPRYIMEIEKYHDSIGYLIIFSPLHPPRKGINSKKRDSFLHEFFFATPAKKCSKCETEERNELIIKGFWVKLISNNAIINIIE